jgi:hypothetical protein
MRFFFAFISKTTYYLFSATNCANVHVPKMTVRNAAAIETSRRSVLSLSKGDFVLSLPKDKTGAPGCGQFPDG